MLKIDGGMKVLGMLAFSIVISACETSPMPIVAEQPSAEQVNILSLAESEWRPLLPDKFQNIEYMVDAPYVKFKKTENSKFISARGGCNAIGGRYKQNGNKLKFSQITTTLLHCKHKKLGDEIMELDGIIFWALHKTRSADISQLELVLKDEHGTPLLVLKQLD